MPTQVTYNSKRIIPAPQLSVDKTYQKSADGGIVGSLFTITINGTLVAFKGSPDSSGVFYTLSDYPADETIVADSRLHALQNKMEAMRELFSTEGQQLEFQAADGSPPMKCNPRINSLSFAQGIWFDRMDYTITCEADTLLVDGNALGEDGHTEHIESASETWSFDTQDDQRTSGFAPTYTLSHTVQAKGKRFYDSAGNLEKDAWKQARDFVLPRLGLDNVFSLASGVNELPGYYNGYNHIRNQNVGEKDGDFSVTETWIIASGDATEDYTVNFVESAEDGSKRVTIDGSINGFETKDSNLVVTKSKWTAARDKFVAVSGASFPRAQEFTGVNNLNPIRLNTTIGRNPIQGTISYSFEYDNRPTNLVSSTKSETISITNGWGANVVASLGILGRAKGPLMQPISTTTQATKSLTIELVFGTDYLISNGNSIAARQGQNPRFKSPQSAQIQSIINAVEPVSSATPNNLGTPAITSYVVEQTETWDIRVGRYSRSLTWNYE